MESRRTDASLALLERAQQRALQGLRRDLASLRAELSDAGAGGELVRRHPFLALTGATLAGVGLGIALRAALRPGALRAAARGLGPARRLGFRLRP